MTGSTTTREKGFLKNSLGDKRSKETILTHIEIGRQNYVRGILSPQQTQSKLKKKEEKENSG